MLAQVPKFMSLQEIYGTMQKSERFMSLAFNLGGERKLKITKADVVINDKEKSERSKKGQKYCVSSNFSIMGINEN